MALLTKARNLANDFLSIWSLPALTINLGYEQTRGNHPFFGAVVQDFCRNACSAHPKMPLLSRFRYGIATCILPPSFEEYFSQIAAAARRNHKKAVRAKFTFGRICYNDHLDEIYAIRCSTEVRQGKMPDYLIRERPTPISNPDSLTSDHDYPIFGIQRDGTLYAYAGCLVAGELCHIEHIFGHAKYQSEGIVPQLIISIAGYLRAHHPKVKYYAYGSYFGASETLRRFKRKFNFVPHNVTWVL